MSDWRKVGSWKVEGITAVIQRSAEWQEFRVRLHTPQGINEAATYHTDDRNDAFQTAHVMAKQTAVNWTK